MAHERDHLLERLNPTLAGVQGALRSAYAIPHGEIFDEQIKALDTVEEEKEETQEKIVDTVR